MSGVNVPSDRGCEFDRCSSHVVRVWLCYLTQDGILELQFEYRTRDEKGVVWVVLPFQIKPVIDKDHVAGINRVPYRPSDPPPTCEAHAPTARVAQTMYHLFKSIYLHATSKEGNIALQHHLIGGPNLSCARTL